MQIGEVPDPFGPIAEGHFLLGSAPAAIPGLRIEAFAELLGGFDSSGVGGRIRITNSKAFLVAGGLGEDASQFDFPSMGGLTIDFARTALRVSAHHGHAGAIELDIEHGNGRTDRDGQIQLPGTIAFLLLACGDVRANRFCGTLDRLGGDRPARQQLDLLPTVLEGSVLTDRGQHASNAGRKFRILYVEFDICRTLSAMTVRTQVIRTYTLGFSYRGEHGFGAQF